MASKAEGVVALFVVGRVRGLSGADEEPPIKRKLTFSAETSKTGLICKQVHILKSSGSVA